MMCLRKHIYSLHIFYFIKKQAIAKFFVFFLFFFWIFFEVFAEIRRTNSILVIVRAFWIVREVESYAPSKFQPPTTLGDHQNVEKTIREKIYFLGLGNQFFVIFPGFWKESAIFSVKINFLVKFCSRYTYSEVRATKNYEKTICAARTWHPRALPARAQVYI